MFEGRRGRMVTPSHRHTAPPSALLAVKIKTNITAADPCLSGLPVRPPELPAAHQQRASRGSDCSIDPRVRHGPSRVLRDRGSESVATRKPDRCRKPRTRVALTCWPMAIIIHFASEHRMVGPKSPFHCSLLPRSTNCWRSLDHWITASDHDLK